MWDFLSFNTFITQDILIFLYYVGAVIIPVVIWLFRNYLIDRIALFKQINTEMKNYYHMLSAKQKMLIWLSFMVMFLFMEIFWRMMFEMMIGYFDMHDYLQTIAKEHL